MDRVLVLSPSKYGAGDDSDLAGDVSRLSHLDVIDGKLPFSDNEFVKVISTSPTAVFHSAEVLGDISRVLKPDGILLLREPLLLEDSVAPGLRTKDSLRSDLVLHGYTSVVAENKEAAAHSATVPCPDGTTREVLLSTFEVTCKKPNWDVGARASLKSKKMLRTNKSSPAPPAASVWMLDDDQVGDAPRVERATGKAESSVWKLLADDADAGAGLEDEDALLEEEDLIRVSPADGGCAPGSDGKLRACANCSCGRADGKVAEPIVDVSKIAPGTTVTIDTSKMPESSCGSCSLGDAFRCSGCPYKGLPRFKPGEKVTLQL